MAAQHKSTSANLCQYNLRERNPSQNNIEPDQDKPDKPQSTETTEPERPATAVNSNSTESATHPVSVIIPNLTQADPDQVVRSQEPQSLPQQEQQDTPNQKDEGNLNKPKQQEHPVISMDHFKEVEPSDKLDLLMAAINTMNTTFHYRMEEVQKEFTTSLQAVTKALLPQVTTLQNTVTELQARVDDLESNLPDFKTINGKLTAIDTVTSPAITALQNKLAKLEEDVGKNTDDLVVLKGYTQVQDKAIMQNKNKIIDLTARSMAQNVIVYGITPDGGF